MAETSSVTTYHLPGRDDRIALPDGSTVSLRHYGDETGAPVLMLHGTPGSRYKFSATDRPAQQNHQHIIAPDRWAYGGTAAPSNPSLLTYARSAGDLMSALGHERFALAGVSGGGPYAAAVAAQLPHRVTALALVSPVGLVAEARAHGEVDWFHRFCFDTLAASPRTVSAIFSIYEAAVRRAPAAACRLTTMRAPAPDHAIMNDPTTRARLLATFAEGLRISSRGPAIDLALFRELTQVNLAKIVAPARIWIGTRDTNVPVAAARRLADRLPNAELSVLPGEGHLWVAHHYDAVLSWIAAAITLTAPAKP